MASVVPFAFHESILHIIYINLLPTSVFEDHFHHFHSMFPQFNTYNHWRVVCRVLSNNVVSVTDLDSSSDGFLVTNVKQSKRNDTAANVK